MGIAKAIELSGLRQNNLKDVSLSLPKERLTVFTGVSGSGKSSIVFATIAVESQRQLNETYPSFIRNRLPRFERPRAATMAHLTPAVVVDQRRVTGNARSTVGTMTEVLSILRVLFSRYGMPSAGESSAYSFNDPSGMCPECDGLGRTVRADPSRMVDDELSLNDGALTQHAVGTWTWQLYARSGLFDPDKPIKDFTAEERDLLLYGSGIRVPRGSGTNAYEGLITRFNRLSLNRDTDATDKRVVVEAPCPECGGARLNAAALASRIGEHNLADYCAMEIGDLIEVLSTPEADGARATAGAGGLDAKRDSAAKANRGDTALDPAGADAEGSDTAHSPAGATCERGDVAAEADGGDAVRDPAGDGARDTAGAKGLEGKRDPAAARANGGGTVRGPAGAGGEGGGSAWGSVVAEAVRALRRIDGIGLGYLTLDRATSTLSGGEAQRLKTVRHLGSSLTGMTYIFDEPSVGLHPADVSRLGELLLELRDKGNTVLVVEHDRDVIALADHVVDMGPGAGAQGGEVVFEGTVTGLTRSGTLTGKRLKKPTGLKPAYREPTGWLRISNASMHNLKRVTVGVPTGVLTAVTGVAGSGKSTLVSQLPPGALFVDQSPIGASIRATTATYLNLMDQIRRSFAKANGVEAALFSHNSKGACPVCEGRGEIKVDLAFMDPVTTTCEACHGTRYSAEALSHTLDGRTIADVLAMTADEYGVPVLSELGLGHLTLGRALSTLSGGERQRLKLAHRLRESGNVYVFDEPTTGLHMADVDTLLALLDRLVDGGNTVIAVEHDLDVVKHADWVIDMGPGAGKRGGEVVFEGTPAALAEASTQTAKYLVKSLDSGGRV
ncbi:ATP-binding cassette domain-containing protein [Nonomuraea sp. NPDC050556]|uniref:ATP-binding cassette domain-containing protein n=1 Tax=Nonomuraea sp. NPDC050556 TaxID=3364369 RepID=UPI0037B09B7D